MFDKAPLTLEQAYQLQYDSEIIFAVAMLGTALGKGQVLYHEPCQVRARLARNQIGQTLPDFFMVKKNAPKKTGRFVEVTFERDENLSVHKQSQLAVLKASGLPFWFITHRELSDIKKNALKTNPNLFDEYVAQCYTEPRRVFRVGKLPRYRS